MNCFIEVSLWLAMNVLALVVVLLTSLSGKRSEGLKPNRTSFLGTFESCV